MTIMSTQVIAEIEYLLAQLLEGPVTFDGSEPLARKDAFKSLLERDVVKYRVMDSGEYEVRLW